MAIKLSFIVPVYNVEQYLRKCVESLIKQDFSNYEIILVDDGSTDDSGAICDTYVSENDEMSRADTLNEPLSLNDGKPQIRVIHQTNAGLSAARNTGIQAAEGEYVCFVDSDDYWEPNVLDGLMEQIERDKLDVLRFKYQHVRLVESRESRVESKYEIFNPYKQSPYRDDDYSAEVVDGVSFLNTRMGTACYAVMFIIRRDLIIGDHTHYTLHITPEKDNCLFTEGIYFEDTDWTPRMLAKAQRVASTDTIVYNYLVRQGSITKAIDRKKQKKVLDDKMRLIGELQRQAEELKEQSRDSRWYQRMISDTVISIINIISTSFYAERKSYLERLRELQVFPICSRGLKARLINFSPRIAVAILHLKNGKKNI